MSHDERIREVKSPTELLELLMSRIEFSEVDEEHAIEICMEVAGVAGPGATMLFPPRMYEQGVSFDDPFAASELARLADSLGRPVARQLADGTWTTRIWSLEASHARLYRCDFSATGGGFSMEREIRGGFGLIFP